MSRKRNFIREWREHRGLTQAELAERSGIDERRIAMVERDAYTCSLNHLRAIAGVLTVEPDVLLDVSPSGERIRRRPRPVVRPDDATLH